MSGASSRRCLEIPVQKIRVIKPRIGGGFGAKQEVLLEDVVGMLALADATGRCFLMYTREEEFVSSRTRHPERMRVRAGAKKDGHDHRARPGLHLQHRRLRRARADGGLQQRQQGAAALPRAEHPLHGHARSTPTCPSAARTAATARPRRPSPWRCADGRDGRGDRHGPARVPDRRNHIRSRRDARRCSPRSARARRAWSRAIGSCELDKCIKLGAKAIGWKKRGDWRKKKGRFRRGIGMACLMQGSSIPEIDMGAASLKMNEDGSFNLLDRRDGPRHRQRHRAGPDRRRGARHDVPTRSSSTRPTPT